MLAVGVIVFFRFGSAPILFKLFLFTSYTSFILALMYALVHYCKTCPDKFKRMLIFAGFSVILVGFITFFGIFNTYAFWNITVSLAILYLLMIELQLIGWTDVKQSIKVKITFAMALVSNLFLAYIFMFKISNHSLLTFIYTAGLTSIAMLFYGIYFYQPEKESIPG